MKKLKIIFIVLFMALSLAPFVLMPWFGNQEAESADADVTLKPLFVDGKINQYFFLNAEGKPDTSIMETIGDYFSKKFALRRQMVDAGDKIKAGVFGTSGQDGVVCGRDGYLFYKDSFDDFLGRDTLSDYQIASMAYDLKLIQDELSASGTTFLFTISPNKNSLYPELMPKRYRPDKAARNSVRLIPRLQETGVFYKDLFSTFEGIEGVMYLRGDSHWNNEGAAIVSSELMESLGRTHEEYTGEHFEVRKDFKGDLYNMLYPASHVTDEQIYYDRMTSSEYNKRVRVSLIDDMTGELTEADIEKDPEWPTASEIHTENLAGKTGSLLMIRDSFGNSLTPFIADEFGTAVFLNGTPYDLGSAEYGEIDTVIFETVERNLDRIIQDAPVLSTTDAALTKSEHEDIEDILEEGAHEEYHGSISAELSDSEFEYTYVSGDLDPKLTKEDVRPFIAIKDNETGKTELKALFRTTRRTSEDSSGGTREDDGASDNEYGFAAYIRTTALPESCRLTLITSDGGGWHNTGVSTEYSTDF